MNAPFSIPDTKPEIGNRLASLAIDYLFSLIITGIMTVPFFIQLINEGFSHFGKKIFPFNFTLFLYIIAGSVIGKAIYLCKDSFNGRSIAKRIFKFQVLDSKTGQVASPMKCLFRNAPTFLWIVELVMALVNPEKRLGDLMASTRLAMYTPETMPQPAIKISQIILTFLCALAFLSLLYGLMLTPFLIISNIAH
ncbi:RDD family protein [Pseudoflavitalea sp. G-6-1-2]|nr:RDD family protein [Pseudoflavitalea sp. G-6-1-2]